MSGKLKPCPFCGSEDIAFDFGIGRGVAYAYCCNCGAESISRASASEAANDWNRRAIDVEAIRRVIEDIELSCYVHPEIFGSPEDVCRVARLDNQRFAEQLRKAVGI